MQQAAVKRWCKRGDTIRTVKPLNLVPGQHLHSICDTPESCAYANELISRGKWEVSSCGLCGRGVEYCDCEQ